ncbi:MAG: cell division topological specificity factor MinE [Anaerolineae bacterium]|jgi:cell division topological specificity factor|nr:cell division topological specificity factor MinE [Anaerolineae bacterium]
MSLWDRLLRRTTRDGSSSVAKNRLQVVLVHDRINLPPERLRELKEELLAVIARYVAVDHDSVAITVEQPDRSSSRLIAEIPFGKGKSLLLDTSLKDDSYTEDDDLRPEADRPADDGTRPPAASADAAQADGPAADTPPPDSGATAADA